MNIEKDGYTLTTDRSLFDVPAIHSFLSKSTYWAKQIPEEVVRRSIENALSFGILRGKEQVAFARVITDAATFAYLSDVYILPEHRGRGLSLWLMETILSHPELQNLRRWVLATRDAHGLYRKFGFSELKNPDWFMEIADRDVYTRVKPDQS